MSELYIEFKLIKRKPKTGVYGVYNIHSGFLLGIIKWVSSWRQYCFFPSMESMFSKGCMNDIIEFIKELMEKRKK